MIVCFVDHLRRKAKPKKHKASNPIDGVSDVTLSTARPRRPRCRFYDKTDQGHPQVFLVGEGANKNRARINY